MNNKGGFYIDVDKAEKWGVIARASVYLNQVKQGRVVAAKSGKNGYIECMCESNKKNYFKAVELGYWPTVKKRGNVQIKIKPV